MWRSTEVSALPFAVWKGGCFGGSLGQQALCDEHMAVVPAWPAAARFQGQCHRRCWLA
jgi:hypothetical protein